MGNIEMSRDPRGSRSGGTMSRPTRHRAPWRLLVALLALLAIVASACGDDDDDSAAADTTASSEASGTSAADGASDATAADDTAATEAATDETEPAADLEGSIDLAFFPNVTHAPALVGVDQGLFEDALGDGVELNT